MDHIINLAAQAFLYGKNKEVFSVKVYKIGQILDIKKSLEVWTKKSPIGKVYNIVIFIQRLPQRWEQFSFIEVSQFDLNNGTMKDLIVVYNNNTWWNSIYNMIKQVL